MFEYPNHVIVKLISPFEGCYKETHFIPDFCNSSTWENPTIAPELPRWLVNLFLFTTLPENMAEIAPRQLFLAPVCYTPSDDENPVSLLGDFYTSLPLLFVWQHSVPSQPYPDKDVTIGSLPEESHRDYVGTKCHLQEWLHTTKRERCAT
jgi:hypothetical protein